MTEDPKIGFATKAEDRAYLDDPPQPTLTGKLPRPKLESRHVDGVRYYAPHLPLDGKKVQILAVGVAPTPEEASSVFVGTHGHEHLSKPKLLKGPSGTIIKDSMDRFSTLQSSQLAYTVVCPWLLPKSRRFKPSPKEIEWAKPALHDLIRELQPEVIVAFGKVAFDQLVNFKINADDARGGWFSFTDTGIPVYLVEPITVLLTQPWMIDTLITDFKEVERMLEQRKAGALAPTDGLEMIEVKTMEQLEALVARWETENATTFSVDCEWAGNNHIDGRLRSIQFCWGDNVAAYLNFFDETGEHHLGAAWNDGSMEVCIDPGNRWVGPGERYVDYQAVGKILGRWLNKPSIRYIGHYTSADSPWMERWLELEVYQRFVFDSAFGQNTVNEYAKSGLERLALTYTNFGRYDLPLVLWKRENKQGEDDGYGKIPDEIMIPYALLDVIVVWQARGPIEAELERQGTLGYFQGALMPFTSDVFHTFTSVGLPVDQKLFELTRKFFNWAYKLLLQDFRHTLAEQANQMVADQTGIALPIVQSLAKVRDGGMMLLPGGVELPQASNGPGAVAGLKTFCPEIPQNLLDHWQEIRTFNIRSAPQVRRWLFDLMGMTPVKTTSNKEKGIPAMLWDKVLELPDKVRAALLPAVDKETMEILASSDPSGILNRLLAVSNVGNQCKGFLKEGEVDEDGEVVKENGLAKFIASDGALHNGWGLTETRFWHLDSWRSGWNPMGVPAMPARSKWSLSVPDCNT